MPINNALLVAAPIIQNYFVDKDTGAPLSGGLVYFYKDNARNVLKNVYQQTASSGVYSYVPLPNPVTLNAVGCMSSNSIDDIIPFYYPYNENDQSLVETYYVVVTNYNGVLQETRQNFPYTPSFPALIEVDNLKNILINGEFWRNIGSINNPTTATILAPGGHSGYTMPDICYYRNGTPGTDTVSFVQFPRQDAPQLFGTVTPEFYFNYDCTAPGSETKKYIQFPLSLHLNSLSRATITVTFWAQAINNPTELQVSYYQYNGTGTIGSQPDPFPIGPVQSVGTGGWAQYTVTTEINPVSGVEPSPAGDDAYYLQFSLPINIVAQILIAKPKVYIGTSVPTNEFSSYDEIDAFINAPRTGDIKISMNNFSPFGYIPMNDGTICNAGFTTPPVNIPFARQNIDTWPLFNYMWNLFKNYNISTTNPLSQMYNSGGTAVAYGMSAIVDWMAGNQLSLTKQAGRVLAGTIPSGFSTTVTAVFSTGIFTVVSPLIIFTGLPVSFTGSALPAGLVANQIYYIIFLTSTTFQLATTFANAMARTPIAITTNGTPPINMFAYFVGSYFGEYSHTQLETELATHHHTGTTQNVQTGEAGSALSINSNQSTFVGATLANINIAPDGNNTPFNVSQPTTFQNIFIKL